MAFWNSKELALIAELKGDKTELYEQISKLDVELREAEKAVAAATVDRDAREFILRTTIKDLDAERAAKEDMWQELKAAKQEVARLNSQLLTSEKQLSVTSLGKAFADGKASVNEHNTEKLNILFKNHELHGQGRVSAHGRVYRLYKCATCPPEAPLQIQIPEDMEWYV